MVKKWGLKEYGIAMLENLRLAWRLFWDRNVNTSTKLIPLLAVIYVLSPIDLLPDIIPALGVTDDVGVFIVALDFFIRSAPENVVRRHRDILEGVIMGKRKNDDRE